MAGVGGGGGRVYGQGVGGGGGGVDGAGCGEGVCAVWEAAAVGTVCGGGPGKEGDVGLFEEMLGRDTKRSRTRGAGIEVIALMMVVFVSGL